MEPNEFIDNFIDILISLAYIIGLFFIIIGIVILAYEIAVYYKIQQINKWSVFKKSGVITVSVIEKASSGYHISLPLFSDTESFELYRTRVAFEYTVNGIKYESTFLSYYEPWSDNITYVTLEDNYYQPGTIVDVILNPNDPTEAYLVNKQYGGYVYLIGAIVFLVVGALLFERATRPKL